MDQPTASSLPYHLYTKKSSSSSLLVGTNSLFKLLFLFHTHTCSKLKIQFSRSRSVCFESSTDPSSRSDMRKGIREFPCRASEMGSLRLFCETFRLRLDFSPLDLSQPISNSLTAYSTATFDRKPALQFTERVYPLVSNRFFLISGENQRKSRGSSPSCSAIHL